MAESTSTARITLYGREGCHLCDDARAVIARVCADLGESWVEVDIDSDEDRVRAIGVLGGISATYKGRYIVDAVLRHDGSSLFGPEEQWNTYWRVDEARLRAALTG